LVIGAIGFSWAVHGMRHHNTRWMLEGIVLLIFVILNVFLFPVIR
jgi:hypothetical protein